MLSSRLTLRAPESDEVAFSLSLSLPFSLDSFHLHYSERNKEADAALGWDAAMKMKREGESVSSDWPAPEERRVCGREMQPLTSQITFYGSCVARIKDMHL